MDKSELAREIIQTSRLTGEFKLRSGKTSNHYFDKYLFESNPVLLAAIADQLAPLVPEGTEVLAGLEMGGIPIATALSLKTGIPVVFVRKRAKEYGTSKLAEGIDITGKKVCIIEDVITTGGQVLLSAADLLQHDAELKEVLCVIENEKAGRANLEEAEFEVHSLFKMEELLAAVEESV